MSAAKSAGSAGSADGAESESEESGGARGGKAREAGAATLAALRRATARKAAELIRNDPDDAATALEIGLVDEEWLQAPEGRPISSSAPGDILRRFLERTVERHPSKLSSLGLTAVQLLSSDDGGAGSGAAGGGSTKQLTVVFTDLEGFTAYTDAHGDAAALALIDEHHERAGAGGAALAGKDRQASRRRAVVHVPPAGVGPTRRRRPAGERCRTRSGSGPGCTWARWR